MRVLMFWQFYPPDRVGHALYIRGVAFAKYLRRLGCKVVVFAPDFDGSKREYVHDGVSVRRVETYDSLRSRKGILPSLTRMAIIQADFIARAKEENPDVVIVSQPSYSLPAQALVAARMLSVPCLLDMQDIFAQDVEFFPNPLRNAMKLRLESFVLRSADSVVTVLPLMRDMAVERYTLDRSKFHILHNGFDSESIPQSGLESQEKDVDLLNLGAPRSYNDSLALIDAMGRIVESRPEAKLVFTNCARDWYEKKVRERVRNLGIEKNVDFLGLLPSREDVFELMRRSRMGVFTLYPRDSSRVLMGTKVFEYLAVGLPIAHLGIQGGSTDLLVREHTVGISARNAKDFAEKALSALGSGSLLDEYSRNSLIASSGYDWKRTVPIMYEEVLRKLVGKNR